MKKTFIIGEIGLNHNGSLENAKKLIDMAVECKIDAVKFQKRNLDICIPSSKKNEMRNTPWGYIKYIDYKKKLEFERAEYNEIDNYCKSKNIEWFASAWDLDSLEFLRKYNLKYNKVASPMLTNIPLIKAIVKEKKETFISTGMATIDNINDVVKIFDHYECPYVLMHSVGIYPCPNNKLNLKMIETLKKRYDSEIGYSCHSPGILASITAVLLGATIIEKHITLNRTSFGTDQAASLEKHGLELMARDIRNLEDMLGDGKKNLLKEEGRKLNSLKYW